MKIESTTVEMFQKEKMMFFKQHIENICPEKRKSRMVRQ
jgi:hypothetical protein